MLLKKRLKTPAAEAIAEAADVKMNLRLESDFTEHDALMEAHIATASLYAQSITSRLIMPQVWECFLDKYTADWFVLPVSPVRSVVAITYIDTDGNPQTLNSSAYELDAVGDVARLRFTESFTTKNQLNAITIELNCGYANAAAVPAAIKQAVIILASHLYENPTGVAPVNMQEVPASFDALLDTYKIYR